MSEPVNWELVTAIVGFIAANSFGSIWWVAKLTAEVRMLVTAVKEIKSELKDHKEVPIVLRDHERRITKIEEHIQQ